MLIFKYKVTKLFDRRLNNISVFIIKKKNVSYDTLAGIPWMSHSRITKIFERVSDEGPFDKITWEKLSERANKIYNSFDIKEIGRILYAYSKVKYRDAKIIYKLTEKIKNKEIHKIDLLGCAHICHALNNLNYFDRKLFELIFSKIMKLEINNNSFPVIITLNAYTKHCNDYLFREMSLKLLIYFLENFHKYKNSCSPQGLAMLLNSFSQVVKPSPDFLKNQNEQLKKICIDENKKLDYTFFRKKGNIINIIHENKKNNSENNIEQCLLDNSENKNYENDIDNKHNELYQDEINVRIFAERNKDKNDENNFNDYINNHIYNESKIIENDTEEKSDKFLGKSIGENFKNILDVENVKKNAETIKDDILKGLNIVKEYDEEIIIKNNKELLNKFFLMLLLQITKNIKKMNTQSLSLVINSCSRISFEVPDEFLKIINEETNAKIQFATIRHLSLIINGYIKLNIKNPVFLSNIFTEIEKKVLSCDEQQLSFILSSMVKLNNKNENLIKNLNTKFILNIRKMNISTLCNILYYYTKLNICNEDIFNLYQIYLKKLIDTANLHHLSLSSYIFSKNKINNEIIFLILNKAVEILNNKITYNEKTVKDILILINSFSELDIYSEMLAKHLYYIIYINETKIDDSDKKYKLEKLINNIKWLNEETQNKIINKNIYLSPKTLSLYKDYIQK
ncbi:conserved Plasmodium protein, unknown function [Plasmodium gallinaceum]|uniref:RNA-editing substrate-binding complex 6 protein domain-containing protein n=1 Tax=Plasmodium gallinaceum TaxID=5849 RepID=A0A1J1GW58_PLAGA|nr:conserved Plasmodium protein, unknown function [Plasmodium gallinaceum]CRG96702.1 conserved Plasmodium protein, unknown function [Plasmodium gallinaceum]